MPEITSIPAVTSESDVALAVDLAAATKAFIVEASSERTRRAYSRQWSGFDTWCSVQARSSLPASPETVALWLSSLATALGHRKPLARSSINQALSNVLLAHTTAGHSLGRKHALIAET